MKPHRSTGRLTLSRDLGEAIVIDGDIRVVVLGIRGGKVRLGIICPDHVQVGRMPAEGQQHGTQQIAWRKGRPEAEAAAE